jgi:hypothetical protein
MNIEEYKQLTATKKKHKYNAKKTVVNGLTFDSIKESNYYLDLVLAKQSGELINFYTQVPFRLPGKTRYILDFLEVWKNGVIKHVDVKGVETQTFRLKKRQVEEIYGITIEVI